jgi:hypothetical protein
MQPSRPRSKAPWARMPASLVVLALLLGMAATPAAGFEVPGPPSNLVAEPGKEPGGVKLSWSPPSDPGGGVSSYVIESAMDWDGSVGTFVVAAELKKANKAAIQVSCGADLLTSPPGTCAYRVRARNPAGTGEPGPAVTIDWQPPGRVQKVRLDSSNFVDVDVTWNPPAQSGGLPLRYDVFVSPDRGGTWHLIADDVATTAFSATGSCWSLTLCSYRVVAENGAGIGPPSKPRHLKTHPGRVRKTTLAKVSDDLAGGSSEFALTWSEPRRGMRDAGYEIQLCPGVCVKSSPGWASATHVPDGSVEAPGLTCPSGLVTCSFRIRASNTKGGVGPWVVRRFGPLAPYAVSAKAGEESATLEVSFHGPDAIGIAGMGGGYRFWVCASACDQAGSWSLHPGMLPYVSAVPPRTALLDCPPGDSCLARVQFVRNDLQTSMLSAASGVSWVGVDDVPGQVSDLLADPGGPSGSVALSWAAPPSSPAIIDYEYRYSVGAGPLGPWTSTGSIDTTFLHADCGLGNTCTYEVRAVNEVGPGVPSAPATASPVGEPAPVTDLEAEASTTTSGAVHLTWSEPPANPAVTHYEYRYRVGAGAYGSWTSTSSVATVLVHTGCGAGNTCTYQVRAVNDFGAGGASSEASATAVEVSTGLPTAITGATAVTGSASGEIYLEWDPVYVNPPVTHYEYRFRDGPGGWSDWTSTGSTDPWFIHACGAGVTCNYQLRAVNVVGAGDNSGNLRAVGAS